MKPGVPALFDMPPDWTEEWEGMPEYVQSDGVSYAEYFNAQDCMGKRLNRYPVYVISKGRWESRLTVKALEALGVPYHVVVEPQEYDEYAKVIAPEKIYTLPFSNLGQGSIPARNWVWEHSMSIGAERHWILDDNISGFGTVQNGRRIKTSDRSFFAICEDFVERFDNIALAGIRYRFHHHFVQAPFLKNTRIYSCILIKNDTVHRWRGRYNEDTDLSLRVLKDGDCTMLFTWCYCDKQATMRMKGGNTDELYKQDQEFDGRLEMAKSLQDQHPDCVSIAEKWGRYQHQVDYRRFRGNKLIRQQMQKKHQYYTGVQLELFA